MSRARPSVLDVWLWPAGLAALTLFALLAALLGQEGVWLWLSWGALAVLLGVPLYHLVASGRRHAKASADSRSGPGRLRF